METADLANRMNTTEIAQRLEYVWFDYQLEAFDHALSMVGPQQRLCYYYPTGKGKSVTSLTTMYLWDQADVLVVTPPVTYKAWEALGRKLGLNVTCVSHAKFRMKDFKVSRTQAVIVDEFHLLGGYDGIGMKKLASLVRGLQAPVIVMSATPNYNDAERCYNIERVLDPARTKGGFLEWLYNHCRTQQNPFGRMPNVDGFLHYDSAADYLAALPNVLYLPDELVYDVVDADVPTYVHPAFDKFGYSPRHHRIMASQIEERHKRIDLQLLTDDGMFNDKVYEQLVDLVGQAPTPVLLYCNHSTVAEALAKSMAYYGVEYVLITGATTAKAKDAAVKMFLDGDVDVLIGTASLATGLDGVDRVCDWLIIVDDTDDASLRRQLIGRIMPRGGVGNAASKQVYRLVLS